MLATSSCLSLRRTAVRPCPAADTAAHAWRRAKPSSSSRHSSRHLRLRAAASSSATTAASLVVPNPQGPGYPTFQVQLQLAPGAEAYQVSLKKPLGLTLTEKSGSVLVDEVVPGGHAAQAGVQAGDVLLATTARPQAGSDGTTQVVLLTTAGQSFKTVSAALRSNTCAQCNIHLVLQRSPAAS